MAGQVTEGGDRRGKDRRTGATAEYQGEDRRVGERRLRERRAAPRAPIA